MNNFAKNLNVLRELSDPEKMKMALERITGKKLADYEGIDALVGALMGYYNAELKNKANSNHTHDDRYYTESEIDTKFKNYCPISIGSIDVRYDTRNPAELYKGTTWELLSSDKYIRTGSTPLSIGGTNSISISKANLPNVKLKVDSFSVSTQPHTHNLKIASSGDVAGEVSSNSFRTDENYQRIITMSSNNIADTSGGANTGTASPYTETLGNGTSISIQPTYITLKFWKRLS